MVVDGQNGSLAKVRDTTDLRRKIEALVTSDEKRRRMGKKARERQLSYFSLTSFIKHFSEIYEKC